VSIEEIYEVHDDARNLSQNEFEQKYGARPSPGFHEPVRPRVYLTERGEESWAYVVQRAGNRTLVQFPLTGRTGWYSTAELTDLS
jgi:hypothetical protein